MHSAIEPFGCSKPHLTFITDPSHRSKTLLAHSKFPSRTKSNLSHPRGNSAERHEVARLLKKQDLFHCVLLAEKITHPDMNLKQDTYIISKLIYIYIHIYTYNQTATTNTNFADISRGIRQKLLHNNATSKSPPLRTRSS